MIGAITLGKLLRARVTTRRPDVCIGGDETPTGCYMARWYVIPRNNFLNIYVHKFMHDDDDRAPHDHPYPSVSMLFEGSYIEHCLVERERTVYLPRGQADVVVDRILEPRYRQAGQVHVRKPNAIHRITLLRSGLGVAATPVEAWSVFFTGTRARVWGFHCNGPAGDYTRFVPHDTFIHKGGCGED